jgi:ketosteroid isomerase-like protein
MKTEKDDIRHDLDRVAGALAAIASGDPQPYKECWAPSEDITLFGAWGPIEKGPDALAETFDWVGERFTGGTLEPTYEVVDVSGDLAYTVGLERGDVSVGGGPARAMTLRVTHVYRRIDAEWRLVHRHADFPPTDRRPRAGLSPAR